MKFRDNENYYLHMLILIPVLHFIIQVGIPELDAGFPPVMCKNRQKILEDTEFLIAVEFSET